MPNRAASTSGAYRAGGTTPAPTRRFPSSVRWSRRPARTSPHEGRRSDPAPALRGRARLVHRARACLAVAAAVATDERLVFTARRDSRPALPRARAGRPLRLPAGDGARRRARPRERRDVHRGHRRRELRGRLHPRSLRARLRGAHRSPLLLPRDRGVRPFGPRRERDRVERPARRASLEHVVADPVATGSRRVVLTGAGGQLGRALVDTFSQDELVALRRADWDVTLPAPPMLAPDLVLHAAAWTDVDGAESDPQEAAAVNVGGTQNAASLGAPLVYYSTDYVFAGRKREPYVESDGPAALSAYGRTKLHGEAAAGDRAWVARSSWLFGPTSHNFVRTMLRLGAERDEVAVVDDQRGCPTYVGHLAAAIPAIVELPFGTYHVAAAGDCTWADFAEAIFEEAGVACRVRRITTEEFAPKAPRPAYSA